MAMSFARPVTYQTSLFNNTHSDYMHETVNIKTEPTTFDYMPRDSPINFFGSEPRMKDFKHSFIRSKSVMSEAETETPLLTRWTTTHPRHWTKTEVLDWIFFVVEKENLDGSKLQGEAYRNFTGDDLCRMNKKEFLRVDPNYGSKMYETFRNLVNDVSFHEPKPVDDLTPLETFNSDNSQDFINLNFNIGQCMVRRAQHNRHSSGEIKSEHSNNKHDNGLVVYKGGSEMIVNLSGLGDYPIADDFEIGGPASDREALRSRLSEAAGFLLPPQTSTPPPLPEFSSLTPSIKSSGSSVASSSSSSSSLSSMPSTKPRSTSLSSYPTSFRFSCMASLDMSATSRLSVPPSSMSLAPSSSQPSAAAVSVPLSFSLSVPSSSRSPSSSSSPPPCRMDGNDLGYSSDDTTFMPPYEATPPRRMFAPCPKSDDMEMGICDREAYRAARYSEDSTVGCGVSDKKKNKKHRNNPTKNGNHLWEFVRDLLRDPKMNPKLLKWEDKENGVFRFVQSEKVAQLWGEKKHNPLMTYEKLSRAMRFCRSAGYFNNVPKNGKFPKKLCFMFGEKAHGWRD